MAVHNARPSLLVSTAVLLASVVVVWVGIFCGLLWTSKVVFTSERTASILAILCPTMSMATFLSPLVTCTIALRRGGFEAGARIQTPLISAFLLCSVLGLGYAARKSLPSLLIPNLASLIIQTLSLACIWTLADPQNPRIAYLVRTPLRKQLAFVCLYFPAIYAVYHSTFLIPLDTMLTPIFTFSNFLPYFATFSSFAKDLQAYRQSRRDKTTNTFDFRTLSFMQLNNILWTSYGFLLRDIAVFSSSVVALVAAGIQFNCLLLPTAEMKCRLSKFYPSGYVQEDYLILVDCAWLFVPREYAAAEGSRVDESPAEAVEMAGDESSESKETTKAA